MGRESSDQIRKIKQHDRRSQSTFRQPSKQKIKTTKQKLMSMSLCIFIVLRAKIK